MTITIEQSWRERLKLELEKSYFLKLLEFITNEQDEHEIYPPEQLIFNAFNKCSFEATKVVIIGQDPYHGTGQANGLCFSVNDGVKHPPSLKNIFKEIKEDLGNNPPISGNLERWAVQGVLLLNATLTVRASTAGSHQKQGWEEFTDEVIKKVSDEKEKVVFILWGAYAQKKGALIDASRHFILKSAHPSPFSAYNGFFGNKHFSKTNEYLTSLGKKTIDW